MARHPVEAFDIGSVETIALYASVAALNTIVGTNGDDTLIGTSGDDLIKPKRGYDFVDGSLGNDKLVIDYSGPAYQDMFAGGSFTLRDEGIFGLIRGFESECAYSHVDSIKYTSSANLDVIGVVLDGVTENFDIFRIDGGGGEDLLSIADYTDTPLFFQYAGPGAQRGSDIFGTIGSFLNFSLFKFNLGDAADTIIGIDGEMWGGGGDDRLGGGAGAGTFRGDAGADTLTGGGGADLFLYQMRGDSSTKFGIDTITDFSHAEGDLISLYLDANKTISGRQDFTFIGAAAFTAPGQLRATDNGDGSYTVEANIDRPLQPDLILIVHVAAPLVAADFVL